MRINRLSFPVLVTVLIVWFGSGCIFGNPGNEEAIPDSLPLIQGSTISPVQNLNHYDALTHCFHFAKPTSTELFGQDSEAVEFARRFIADQFGPLPFELKLKQICHSVSGNKMPTSEEDQGYMIEFDQYFLGFKIDGLGAGIHIKGKQVYLACMDFVDLKPVPGSDRKLLSKDAALAILKKRLKIEGPIVPKSMTLQYVWFPDDNMAFSGIKVFRPNWCIVAPSNERLYVDAFEGRLWRND